MENTERLKLRVIAPGLEFLLPYIARQLPRYEVITDGEADKVVEIAEPEGTPSTGSNHPVLICPNIVGTGMTGFPMVIARKIANGMYLHIEGYSSRLSTIHAVDVAKAVELVLDHPGKYVITDGENPTIHDFAEALAWRIGQKRILTVKPSWAKWLIKKSWREKITTDATVDGSEFAKTFNFKPTAVTQYLRTHIYDDESL